jgi:two-component system, chemotaxis family, sensor kinase CheA
MTQRISRGVSVRAKLIGLALGTSVLALLLACASFVYYDRTSYAAAKQSTLSVLVRSVAQSAFGPTAFGDAESAGVILKVLESEPSARSGAIYSSDGTQLSAWGRDGAQSELPAKWDVNAVRSGYSRDVLELTSVISNSGGESVGALYVLFSTADLEVRTRNFLALALLVLLVSAGVALVMAAIAQRVLTRPVEILAAAAHRVEVERNLDIRAERVSNDELGRLTDAFNGMLDMIKGRDAELAEHRSKLEEIVAERTRNLDERNKQMRMVLDHVEQGMVVLSRDGVLDGERSAALDRWFGAPAPHSTLWSYLEPVNRGTAAALAMSWGQLQEDILPLELNLAQLPSRFEGTNGRHFEIAYQPIFGDAASFAKMLVLITDVTERVVRERSEAVQAETLALFEQITADRTGFQDFLDETESTMKRLLSPEPRDVTEILRELHTLKGNTGLFGLRTMAKLLHEIEDECLPERSLLSDEQRARLKEAWDSLEKRARTFLGENGTGIAIDRAELDELQRAITARTKHEELARLVDRFLLTAVSPRLWRIGESAKRLASRLGKGDVQVTIDAEGVKASPDLGWLWQVLPHVLGNAIDHGLETPEERAAAHKAGPPELTLRARERQGALSIEIADNGRGIAWEGLLRRARDLGMPANDNQDALAALFADGVSTRSEATTVSGRGIGLAAVKAACDAHGARVRIASDPGQGTTFRFELKERGGTGRTPSLQRLSKVSSF